MVEFIRGCDNALSCVDVTVFGRQGDFMIYSPGCEIAIHAFAPHHANL